MDTSMPAMPVQGSETDFLPLEGTDHIEFYVGNAKQAAHYYRTVLGFQPLAYAGPETGLRDRVSYVLRQQKMQFVFLANCRDSVQTRMATQRFFEWLEQAGEAELLAARAKARARIVSPIAKEQSFSV